MPKRADQGSTLPTDAGEGDVAPSGVLRVSATRRAPDGAGEPLLVLTAPDGGVFHLPVDGSLRTAVRTATASPDAPEQTGAPAPLRPKDIQARIRGGESAAEVAEAAGVSVEAVDRYAGPVLAERSHVASVARATVVRSARSRPSLEDLVRHRLASRGVALGTVAWDAWRRGEAGWVLQVGFRAGTRDRVAQWRYDPVSESVDPLDDEARWLSASHEAESPGAGASSRRLSSVRVFDVESEGGVEDEGVPVTFEPSPPVDAESAADDPDGEGAEDEQAWGGPDHDEVAARTMDLLEALSDRRGRRQPMVDLEEDLDDEDPVDEVSEAPSPQADENEGDDIGPGYGSGFPAHQRSAPGRARSGGSHLRSVAAPAGVAQGGDGDTAETALPPDAGQPWAERPSSRRAAGPGQDVPAAQGEAPGLPGAGDGSGATEAHDPPPAPGDRADDARGAQETPEVQRSDETSRRAVEPEAALELPDVPTSGSIGTWVGPASPTALPSPTAQMVSVAPSAPATGGAAPSAGPRAGRPGAPDDDGAGTAAAQEPDQDRAPDDEERPEPEPASRPARGGTRSRAGRRSSVPSWDEIVFGSAPEDPQR